MTEYKELDKIPLFTPYVSAYRKTKTSEGIAEGSATLKRYYSSINAEIYFNNEYVEDICDIQFSLNQAVQPLFGFNSYTFDDIAVGTRYISGTFSIRFTSPNYLFNILATAEEQNSITSKISYTVPTHSKEEYLPIGESPSTGNSASGTNDAPLWPQTFDIDIVYGNENSVTDEVHIILEDVHIVSLVNGASAGNPVPLTETYSFVARDLKTLD